jgi:hypothetical protein
MKTGFGEVNGCPHSANSSTDDQYTIYAIHFIEGMIVKFILGYHGSVYTCTHNLGRRIPPADPVISG